ncbi:MAG: hypothetical protein L6Q98_19210 [Anaerolineae bacterium]|nr:hypothetical protein [Anaerolineae bacterium]
MTEMPGKNGVVIVSIWAGSAIAILHEAVSGLGQCICAEVYTRTPGQGV